MTSWSNFYFQDSSSPLMEQLILFHDHTMMILMLIITLVLYIMIILFMNKYLNKYLFFGQMIELIWTILPTLILVFTVLPSLHLLYLLDDTKFSSLTLKVIGHQWYWSYEYPEFNMLEFDSYMLNNNLELNLFRLLDVDNRIVLPLNYKVRILISSMDVIHSWSIPSLGVKLDAVPGRLNQTNLMINRSSLFFGQCSEICGSNHSFMPIVIESVNLNSFINWINSKN